MRTSLHLPVRNNLNIILNKDLDVIDFRICTIYSVLFSILLFPLSACKNNASAPDLSGIEADVDLIRYEHLLFDLDTSNLKAELESLTDEHRDFSEVFFYQIVFDPSYEELVTPLKLFLSDSGIQHIYQVASTEFSDFGHYHSELEKTFQYLRYYLPQAPVPDVYTCVTGFEVGAFTIGPEIVGIGLEFFLGDAFPSYDPQLFPVYIRKTMNKEHLVSKTVQALVEHYTGDVYGNRLIDYMIRNGKVLYVKKKLLPEADDLIIHEFDENQLDWIIKNEGQIWVYLLDQELLYDINYRKFQKLISPSPNVPGMPEQAPGRVGNWVGFRIVEAYMERNPDVTIQQLLNEEDSQKILAESKYKPRL